jgi:Spy/CpxP family protein refolding chaperone
MSKTSEQFDQLRKESRPKFLAIREQSEQQMKAVLTPEQQTKLQQLLQDDHDRGDRGGGDHDHDRDSQKQQR